jgi:VanZ family protein
MARVPAPRVRSSAVPLAWAYLALIVYASLYPFTGWRWPPGQELADLAALPWPRYFPKFDIFANLAGYLPMGALMVLAAVRNRWRAGPALLFAVGASALLSFGMELTQNFLPDRVPSRLDWLLNTLGGVAGALLAASLHAVGGLHALQRVRDRWFLTGSAGARVLLLLWPIGLLFPTPLPLAQGQIGDELRRLAAMALADTPWADRLEDWLTIPTDVPPLSPPSEWLTITLALLAPCLVVHAAVRPGLRRVAMVWMTLGIGFATTVLSNVLNFGPGRGLAWLTPTTLPALAAGAVIGTALSWIGRRFAAGLGLVVLSALVALVAQAPADPYLADSLQSWQQGRFIHFYGLAQWIGWLWPYGAIVWLLVRIGARETDGPQG